MLSGRIAPRPTSRRPDAARVLGSGRVAGWSLRSTWFALLLAAICFEGLGRKLLPEIPGAAFYFAKDGVLLGGLLAFGMGRPVVGTAARLFGGFIPLLPVAVLWTILQVANPEQPYLELAILGLRAYWLWWLAPLVVATALAHERDRTRGLVVLGVFAGVIGGFALVQFALPPSHPLNQYAATGPEMQIALVGATGRARVTSTFSYITGFTDFAVVAPALLLSIGLASTSSALRKVAFGATVVMAAALPTSGSRGPIVLSAAALAAVAYAAGLLWSRQGRRVIGLGIVAVVTALAVSSDAVEGVRSRFVHDADETRSRFVDSLSLVPPFAMAFFDYPTFGLGTGTLQNAASTYAFSHPYAVEGEQGRILVEQGVPGYLLLSLLRVGLIVALVRAGWLLKRAGKRPEAGAAWALAVLTLPQNLIFDHIFQALYFLAVGIVLESAVRAMPLPGFVANVAVTTVPNAPPDRAVGS